METPKRLTSAGERFDRLVDLFTPYVMRAVTEEIDTLLKSGFTTERLDDCIAFIEGYDVGMFKKAFALRLLKRKRKQVSNGKPVTLSIRERDFLIDRAEKYLPERVVRCWIHAITESDAPNNLSIFDDAMLPLGAEITLYREKFAAFGVSPDVVRMILRNVRASENRMPQPVIDYLVQFGFKDDLS